jgi:hypothetical protein
MTTTARYLSPTLSFIITHHRSPQAPVSPPPSRLTPPPLPITHHLTLTIARHHSVLLLPTATHRHSPSLTISLLTIARHHSVLLLPTATHHHSPLLTVTPHPPPPPLAFHGSSYVYTWTNQRLWRKNRSPPPERSTCHGVDLNRNYNVKWGEGGSSTNPCSETYAASRPL